jgi:nitric oxide synthase-interacting protein
VRTPSLICIDGGNHVLHHKARGTKRKFEFDTSTIEILAREAEEAALREIEREQAEALKHKLPDFWLPSLTPTYTSTGPPQSITDVKLQTTCRGGNPPHPIAYVNSSSTILLHLMTCS